MWWCACNSYVKLLWPSDAICPYRPGQYWHRYWFVAWWHQAITWTNVDLSWKVFCGIHRRANSHVKCLWIKSMACVHWLHFSNYYDVLLQPQWVNWWEEKKPAHRTHDMQNNASINSITMTTVNTIDRKPKASINTLRPEQKDHQFTNDFKMH